MVLSRQAVNTSMYALLQPSMAANGLDKTIPTSLFITYATD